MIVRDWSSHPVYFKGGLKFKEYTLFVSKNQYYQIDRISKSSIEELESSSRVLLIIHFENSGQYRRRLRKFSVLNYWLKVQLLTQKQDSPVQIRLVDSSTSADTLDVMKRILGSDILETKDYAYILKGSLQPNIPVKKYRLNKRLTPYSAQVFAERVLKDKPKPYIRSQNLQPDQGKRLKTLIGSTFTINVLKSRRPVIVGFYSSLANNELSTQRFLEIFESAASQLQESKSSQDAWISTLDTCVNDAGLSFKIANELPSAVYFPSGKKDNPLFFKVASAHDLLSLLNDTDL